MKLFFSMMVGILFIAGASHSYPQIDPNIQTQQECQSKAGDWDDGRALCTLYVSDGSNNEGDQVGERPLVIEDGCFQMTQRFDGGISDAGLICIQGLAHEGAFQRLKIVTADSQGQMHFCGESHQFSPLKSTSAQAHLEIQIVQPAIKIVFAGKPSWGNIAIGTQNFDFVRIPNEPGFSFFNQCQF